MLSSKLMAALMQMPASESFFSLIYIYIYIYPMQYNQYIKPVFSIGYGRMDRFTMCSVNFPRYSLNSATRCRWLFSVIFLMRSVSRFSNCSSNLFSAAVRRSAVSGGGSKYTPSGVSCRIDLCLSTVQRSTPLWQHV